MHENRETSGASRSIQDRDRLAKAQSHKANMHAPEESDCAVIPMNQPNKEEPSAEVGEGRARAKENIVRSNTSPTQSGERVSQGLSGVRQAAKGRRQEQFTALLHHLTVGLLRDSFYALKRQAAPGVDGVTWKEYETGLEDRIVDLHSRVHCGAYQAQPSRRVYIPKADGRQRPLGIAALEDKIIQQAVVTILNQIYEVDFKGFSYGFRPGRNPHQALDALTVGIQKKRVNWVLDADIRGFFDNLSHEWALRFVEPTSRIQKSGTIKGRRTKNRSFPNTGSRPGMTRVCALISGGYREGFSYAAAGRYPEGAFKWAQNQPKTVDSWLIPS
jgi:RNA-directed DNA polymerase